MLGRGRYERRLAARGSRHEYEDGILKTVEDVIRVQGPQGRGLADPSRSQLWTNVARPREPRKSLRECVRAICALQKQHEGPDRNPAPGI